MAQLKIGASAPSFELADQSGRKVKLSDYRGQLLLVYFYPKADTPGCTAQACSVRDHWPQLRTQGVAVVGISPDPPERQAGFDAKYQLGFPLLADPDHTVAMAYGAWGQRTVYGRKATGILRSAFLIDGDGKLLGAWYQVGPEEMVPRVFKQLAPDQTEDP